MIDGLQHLSQGSIMAAHVQTFHCSVSAAPHDMPSRIWLMAVWASVRPGHWESWEIWPSLQECKLHVPQLAGPVFQHLCDDRHGGRDPEVIRNIPQYISISCPPSLPSFPIDCPFGISCSQDRPNQSLQSLFEVIDLLIRHEVVLLTRGRCASGRQLRGGPLWDWT